MHLSTEQHGAYLLLLFHLWCRGILPDDDVVLAQITGLSISAWSTARAVLGEFFEIRDGLWHHGRVERERSRIAAKQTSNSNKAKLAAYGRWGKPGLLPTASDAAGDACSIGSSDASGTAPAMPDDAKPDSEPELCWRRGLEDGRTHRGPMDPLLPAGRSENSANTDGRRAMTDVACTDSPLASDKRACFHHPPLRRT
jgi:Protein of unknown function (DUF1376)